jgi:hypothetical protein
MISAARLTVAERRLRRDRDALFGRARIAGMASIKRGLFVLTGLLALSFGVHYVLFGSLPLGKPELLRDDEAVEVEVE